jgi:hypothetical protein
MCSLPGAVFGLWLIIAVEQVEDAHARLYCEFRGE